MRRTALLGGMLAILASRTATADDGASAGEDRFTFSAHSETSAQLFRRALLPGSNGALVATETALPITEYVVLSARDVDTPWERDSVDLELSLWGRVGLQALAEQRTLDGDVQSAYVRQRLGAATVRLGRQQVAGGAARYARIDGLDLTWRFGRGLWAEAYGGFTVMPRWNERPSYLYLGTAADSGVRRLAETPAAARDSLWQAGARLGLTGTRGDAVLSFHEQHEALGLSHRNLGADARLVFSQRATLGGKGILDLDASRFADAALFLDYVVSRHLDVSLDYFHTEPALLLSRQSVLAVFSSDSYEEVGGAVRVHPLSSLTLQALGFANAYSSGDGGGRAELSVSSWLETRRLTFARLAYARVAAPDNGYHSLRASLARKLGGAFTSTLEGYYYFYERPIRGFRSSSVYAATLSYRAVSSVSLLAGASLARTPDASLDAQGQLRVSCDFDFVRRRRGL